MKAIVIGGTGATGKDLIPLLLDDPAFDEVLAFSRRELSISHPKLKVAIISFDNSDEWNDMVKGDVLFSCLGTTLKAAGSKECQWRIDYDYQFEFAMAAKENGVSNYVLVSAAGASPNSSIFYSKMKGNLEDAIRELGFEKAIVLRPPLLRRKKSDRAGEVFADKFLSFFNSLGLLKNQKAMPTETLAKAMISSSKISETGFVIKGANDIWKATEKSSL